MENENTEDYFSWSDSWVFTALYYSNFSNRTIDLKNIIAAGDVPIAPALTHLSALHWYSVPLYLNTRFH